MFWHGRLGNGQNVLNQWFSNGSVFATPPHPTPPPGNTWYSRNIFGFHNLRAGVVCRLYVKGKRPGVLLNIKALRPQMSIKLRERVLKASTVVDVRK